MQTGPANLQKLSDIDSIESRCEKGKIGVSSKSQKDSSGDSGDTFLIHLIAQHTPANNEKGQLNEITNVNTNIAKHPDADNGKLDKVLINDEKADENVKQHLKIAAKTSSLRSEPGVEVNEKTNAKPAETNQLSPGIVVRKTDSDIEGQFRASELTGRKMASLKNEINHLEDKLSPQSDNDARTRFINPVITKTSAVVKSLDAWQKYMTIKGGAYKPQVLEGNIELSKVINVDTNDGDETNLTSNNQAAERHLESVTQSKEPPSFQRQFQPVVMRQLVEKAMLGVEGGRSQIKINLKPEVLGHLRMKISTENNQVSIRIITEVPMVKDIIESNLNQLRADFQNHGLEIEKFNVFVDSGSTQNERSPSHILFKNDEGRTGEERAGSGLSEKDDGNVQNSEKWRNNTLIDFFA